MRYATYMNTKQKHLILITLDAPDENYRLCKDGNFRDFSYFGTLRQSFKTYDSIKRALNVSKKIPNSRVVAIPTPAEPNTMYMEASGLIIETYPSPEKEGYVCHKHHKISEYFVNPETEEIEK